MEVVLAGLRVELPGGAREEGAPVVRLGAALPRLPAAARRTPPVPVALRVVGGGRRLDEPRVLVGRVVDDEVHDELHAARVQPLQQLVEVVERAEERVDRPIVADVVAVVVVRGGVDGREPDHVDAESLEVVEVLDDAPQVADAVAVAVCETPRIDLIDDRRLPPLVASRAHPTRGARCGRPVRADSRAARATRSASTAASTGERVGGTPPRRTPRSSGPARRTRHPASGAAASTPAVADDLEAGAERLAGREVGDAEQLRHAAALVLDRRRDRRRRTRRPPIRTAGDGDRPGRGRRSPGRCRGWRSRPAMPPERLSSASQSKPTGASEMREARTTRGRPTEPAATRSASAA